MCFGINTNGQVTNGYTGQVDKTATRLYQENPNFGIVFGLPTSNTFKLPWNINNGNFWNLRTPYIINNDFYGNSNTRTSFTQNMRLPFSSWNIKA